MKPSITIRIYLKDYNRCKRIFPAVKGESAASYFERLSKYLEDLK